MNFEQHYLCFRQLYALSASQKSGLDTCVCIDLYLREWNNALLSWVINWNAIFCYIYTSVKSVRNISYACSVVTLKWYPRVCSVICLLQWEKFCHCHLLFLLIFKWIWQSWDVSTFKYKWSVCTSLRITCIKLRLSSNFALP